MVVLVEAEAEAEVEARAEAATATEEGGMAIVAPEAAAATAEPSGTERSTSRCLSCRTNCSQLLHATRSPQTCAR